MSVLRVRRVYRIKFTGLSKPKHLRLVSPTCLLKKRLQSLYFYYNCHYFLLSFSLSRRRHSSFGEYKLLSFLLSVLPSASLLHAGAIEDVMLFCY